MRRKKFLWEDVLPSLPSPAAEVLMSLMGIQCEGAGYPFQPLRIHVPTLAKEVKSTAAKTEIALDALNACIYTDKVTGHDLPGIAIVERWFDEEGGRWMTIILPVGGHIYQRFIRVAGGKVKVAGPIDNIRSES